MAKKKTWKFKSAHPKMSAGKKTRHSQVTHNNSQQAQCSKCVPALSVVTSHLLDFLQVSGKIISRIPIFMKIVCWRVLVLVYCRGEFAPQIFTCQLNSVASTQSLRPPLLRTWCLHWVTLSIVSPVITSTLFQFQSVLIWCGSKKVSKVSLAKREKSSVLLYLYSYLT